MLYEQKLRLYNVEKNIIVQGY